MSTIYYLTDDMLQKAIKMAEKMTKKAAQLGIPQDISLFVRQQDVRYMDGNGQAHELPPKGKPCSKLTAVELSGVLEPLKMNGWRFAAKMTCRGLVNTERNMVYAVPGINLPESFYTAPMACEHCKQNRKRLDTIILTHDDGRFIQVGTGCIEEYLGSAEFAKYCEHLAQTLSTVQSLAANQQTDMGRSLYNLEEILLHVDWIIKNYGWVSSSKADHTGERPTSQHLKYAVSGDASYKQSTVLEAPYVLDAIEWAKNMTPVNSYEQNLKTIATSMAVGSEHFGLVASLLPYWRVKTTPKKPVEVPTSKWMGTIGELFLKTLRLDFYHEYETAYGIKAIYSFTDEDGNKYVWYSAPGKTDWRHTYIVKGKIADHTTYKGVQQTVITHCKMVKDCGIV